MSYDLSANRRNARRSRWTLPGSRDTGQRYVVRYRDGMGTRRDYGFTESHDVAEQWREAVNRNPLWDSPRIIDRKART